MSTNYYLAKTCGECGHSERLHVGKSSAGWTFSLHVEPDRDGFPSDLPGWSALFADPGWAIEDEYGRLLSEAEMTAVISERSWPAGKHEGFDWLANHAQPGPNGLVRHTRGGHCIAHGDGTYDLITGEFS
jgi:hypothetical protein